MDDRTRPVRRGGPLLTGVRRQTGRALRHAGAWGRQLGVLPYQPEERSAQEWSAAYGAGDLGYYGRLDELARYSVIVGYIQWSAAAVPGGPPSVCDVGCGTGLLRERLDGVPFSSYVGVDLSSAAISAASSRDHPRSRFVVGDAASLELGRFDVVVLNEVLYYAPDAMAFLERIRGVISPDGLLLVSMWRHPGDRTLWRTVDAAFPILDRVAVRNPGNPVNRRGWTVALCGGAAAAAAAARGVPR